MKPGEPHFGDVNINTLDLALSRAADHGKMLQVWSDFGGKFNAAAQDPVRHVDSRRLTGTGLSHLNPDSKHTGQTADNRRVDILPGGFIAGKTLITRSYDPYEQDGVKIVTAALVADGHKEIGHKRETRPTRVFFVYLGELACPEGVRPSIERVSLGTVVAMAEEDTDGDSYAAYAALYDGPNVTYEPLPDNKAAAFVVAELPRVTAAL